MAIPTGANVKTYLEGYGVTDTVLTNAWIEARRDNYVIPTLKKLIGFDFVSGDTITEYLSGNGKGILVLSNRNILTLVSAEYVQAAVVTSSISGGVVLNGEDGFLIAKNISPDGVVQESIFRKGEQNIKVVYTIGALNAELEELILYQLAKICLNHIATRTGGGDLSTQGYSRNYGNRGKYTHLINELDKQSAEILSHYNSGVVGS